MEGNKTVMRFTAVLSYINLSLFGLFSTHMSPTISKFNGALWKNLHVLITFFLPMCVPLVMKLKKTRPWLLRLSMKACRLVFMWRTRDVFAVKIKRTWWLRALLRHSFPFNHTLTNECLYNVQDNAERAIVYCNVNLSCIVRYSLQSQIYFITKLSKLT